MNGISSQLDYEMEPGRFFLYVCMCKRLRIEENIILN